MGKPKASSSNKKSRGRGAQPSRRMYHTIWQCGNGEWGHGVSLYPMSDDFFWAQIGFETEDAAIEATTPRPSGGYVLVLDIPSNDSHIRTLNRLAMIIQKHRAENLLDFP